MSKYNHMKSISFSELKEDEIEQAIREWSQGNLHMEKLLWACKDNGIETLGSHPLARPYLELAVNNSHKAIGKMLCAAQSVLGSQILVSPDGGNPLGGESWYRPTINIGFVDLCERQEVNEALDKLYESVVLSDEQEMQENGVFMNMLDFHDFFAEKESGFYFYMGHNKSGLYRFSISCRGAIKDAKCYESIFGKADMKLDSDNERWIIEDKDETIFDKKIKKAKTIIMEEYALGLPQEIKPNMGLVIKGRIMKRQFGDTPEGKQKFSEWLNKLRLYINREMTYEECFSCKEQSDKVVEDDERC